MVQSFNDDFAVVWADPSLAQQTLLYDPMHHPRPLVPLAGEYLGGIYRDFMSAQTVLVNGYAFSTQPTPRPPTPAILERGVGDVWIHDLLPPIESWARAVRSANYDAMDLATIGNAIPGILDEAIAAFGNTMIPITGFMGPTFAMVAFLEDAIGEEGPQLGAALLQGQANGTAEAGSGLTALADAAKARPAVAAALRAARFDSVRSVEGGAEFGALLDQYLDTFGWRADSWGAVERPTWAEAPEVPLALVARYLDDETGGADGAIERAGAQREAAMERLATLLNPEQMAHLQEMIEVTRSHVPVSEGRAMWQLIATGSLRVPVLALGRKLVEAGALVDPSDAFYFTTEELRALAQEPDAAARATAGQRRADYERWQHLTPPPFLGVPPDPAAMPPEMRPLVKLFFGGAPPSVEGREIKGQGASRGVVTGRARVIHDLSDAPRLERGDILVCQTTAPPWTPLFAIASAVVTDAGGVLSHSAICAREYGIPCVVATQIATHMIEDGATITVDGVAGIVRIEA